MTTKAYEAENELFIKFENVHVRTAGKCIFENLTFKVKKGEHWILIGSSGAGKSAFLKVLEGYFNVTTGKITRQFYNDFVTRNLVEDPFFSFNNLIASVGEKHHFKNNSNTSSFYYQQRYNSYDSEDSLTVKEYLDGIYTSTTLPRKHWDVAKVLQLLLLEGLAEKQLIKLSNGETKRLLIAAALVKNPLLLLLDNPLIGLDINMRRQFNAILDEVIKSGITIIMTGTYDEIPDGVTHIGFIHERKIKSTWKKEEFNLQSFNPILDDPGKNNFDINLFEELQKNQIKGSYENIVKLNNVRVHYDNHTILDGINWTVKPGEHWILSGPNGSGKSTLLSLLNGDNPQAYSNDITLFDRKRGTGESIWDIKRKVGFVSPELYQYFPIQNTCLQVIESGFYDTQGLFKNSDALKKEIALKWMTVFNILEDSSSLFTNISSSRQRICLLARALIKNPALLILDEPCQGLDVAQQRCFRQIVKELCKNSSTTIIYVTHHREEIPEGFVQELKLS